MTTMDLRAEIYGVVDAMGNDESLLERGLAALRRVLTHAEDEDDEADYVSKEEVLDGIRQGLREVKLMEQGKLREIPAEEVLNEL